jgi:uncharacterized protein YdeI (YjbR/CyaY-like superfamily)
MEGDKKTERPLPILAPEGAEEWARWLAKNHRGPGVWLKLARKAPGVTSLTYGQAVEEALAWGWIDGQKRALDQRWWLQKFTPRGPRSLWSKVNRDKALALIAAGRMRAPGLAEVERARRDGRWKAAYAPQSRAEVPPDLQRALRADPRAAAFFATLDAANRYAILFRVGTAKKPETRARRIATFVAMLAEGRTLHPR